MLPQREEQLLHSRHVHWDKARGAERLHTKLGGQLAVQLHLYLLGGGGGGREEVAEEGGGREEEVAEEGGGREEGGRKIEMREGRV